MIKDCGKLDLNVNQNIMKQFSVKEYLIILAALAIAVIAALAYYDIINIQTL